MTGQNTNLGKWEKRWHPLRREWVVYAAHRNTRPWRGAPAKSSSNSLADYDPTCYLCPGNKRVSNKQNPKYDDIFVFENDHPVVSMNCPDIPHEMVEMHNSLYQRASAKGIAKVVCYHPKHNLTLSEVPLKNVIKVFECWKNEMIEFIRDPNVKYVLIFENKGEAVGVSNPHPHCQIYATDFIFNLTERELAAVEEHRVITGRNLFSDIIEAELKDEIRIIAQNEHALAFIPFFARYAYEVMIFPHKKHATLATMSTSEIAGLADVFQQVIRKYDLNFNMSFPYVMSILQAPVDGKEYADYHLHLLLQPPYRQPGLIKYLAGPEIGGGNFMADTMPEEKAAELRKIDLSVYKEMP